MGCPAINERHQGRPKRYHLSNDHWKQVSKLIPNYSPLSPNQFKELLVDVIPLGDQHKIEQWLANFPMLQLAQQRAELLSTVFQLEIEKDYWKFVSFLTTNPTVIWLSEIPKEVIKTNSINWDPTKTKENIKRCYKMITNQLEQALHRLHNNLKRPYPSCSLMGNVIPNHERMSILFQALLILARNNLQYFRTNFEQKKILLEFDMDAAHLVKSLYDLNPTEEQVSIIHST